MPPSKKQKIIDRELDTSEDGTIATLVDMGFDAVKAREVVV